MHPALGAVLSQEQDVVDVERPEVFAPRNLTFMGQRYSVSEREAIACVWATYSLQYETDGTPAQMG